MQEQSQKHIQSLLEILQHQKTVSEYSKFIEKLIQLIKIPLLQVTDQIRNIIDEYFHYTSKQTIKPVCAKIFVGNQFGFRCQQCIVQGNSIICIQCFNKSDHKGHRYMKIPVNGCCDCGNEQMWNPAGSCPDHKGSIQFVEVDEKQMQKFIKQIQFLLSIHYLGNKKTSFKLFAEIIQLQICRILSDFNAQSLISNQMTAQLLQSKFNNKFQPSSMQCVIQYIFQNFRGISTGLMTQIFIMLFTRPKFKLFLAIKFTEQINKDTAILQTQFLGIGDQVYTSYKLISQLIDSKQLKPISPNINSKINSFTSYFQIFYAINVYLQGLSRLSQGVGQKYMRYHMLQGNISQTIIHNKYIPNIHFKNKLFRYQIQLQVCDKMAVCFSHIKHDKKVILKGIKDLINYFNLKKDHDKMSLFIPQQRLLILLIFAYFDGKYEDKIDYKFINQIGLSYKLLYRLLQSVLYVLRFNTITLSNFQTAYRFWQYYQIALCHNNYLISLDLQIIKFCLLGLQYIQPIEIQYFDENLSIAYQKQLTYLQNQMPIQNLLRLPTKFIEPLIANTQQIKCGQQDIYDRAKALGMLTDYIGILHESILTNHTSLTINSRLQIKNKQEIINFYGQIIKSYNFKISQFASFCKVFFLQPFPFLQIFIKQYCDIINERIQLKSDKLYQFKQINLTYFKSKKNCTSVSFTVQQNQKICQLQSIPQNHKNEIIYEKLKQLIFSKAFIQKLVKIGSSYKQIMSKNEAFLKSDVPHFALYIKELIKLNYSLQNKEIYIFMQEIKTNQTIFNYLPEAIKKQISKLFKQKKQEMKIQEQINQQKLQKNKMKMKQIKTKKLQKFKQKQQSAIKKIAQNQQHLFHNNNMQEICCMLCKMGSNDQPLLALSYIQKSNLLHKYYLQTQKSAYFITTCGHFIHKKCALQIYNNIHNIFCQFCSSYSNILLGHTTKEVKSIKRRKSMTEIDSKDQIDSQVSTNICKQIQQIELQQQHKYKQKLNKEILKLEKQKHNNLGLLEKIVQGIASSIVYALLLDYKYFAKSQARACFYIFQQIKKQKIIFDEIIKSVDFQIENRKQQNKNIQAWEIYKLALIFTCNMFGDSLFTKHNNEKQQLRLQQNIRIQIVKSMKFIFQCLKCSQSLLKLIQVQISQYKPFKFRQIPKSLSQFEELTVCPNCKNKNNEIVICLLCQFSTCVGCKDTSLTSHAINEHYNSTIYLRVDGGYPIYVNGFNNYLCKPIYANYMGQTFASHTCYKTISCQICINNINNKKQFILKQDAYKKIKDDLIHQRVQQQLKYMKNKSPQQNILI